MVQLDHQAEQDHLEQKYVCVCVCVFVWVGGCLCVDLASMNGIKLLSYDSVKNFSNIAILITNYITGTYWSRGRAGFSRI